MTTTGPTIRGCSAVVLFWLTGGCSFPVDPDIAAPDAPICWQPEQAPAAVTPVASLSGMGLTSLDIGDDIVERRDDRGLSWIRLSDGAVLVGMVAECAAASLGILLPLDDDWSIRMAAAERLRSWLTERAAVPLLTAQQHERLKRALRTLDGRRDGASYREIATVLFGAHRVADEPWKTSSLKAQVARLARHGRMLTERGYRSLLLGRGPTGGRSASRV